MRRGLWWAGLVMLIVSGCGRTPEPAAITAEGSERGVVLRADGTGLIGVVFVPHPVSLSGPPAALERALAQVARSAPCSAAIFLHSEDASAHAWIHAECARRRENNEVPRLLLAGHSWGATRAGEIAHWLLKREPDAQIDLLLTIDAVKSTTIGSTTGAAATLLTLNNPVPGKSANFVAYTETPPVDSTRLRRHLNYYEEDTTLMHGSPIPTASENRFVGGEDEPGVNHGNIDDYVYAPVLAAFRRTILKEGR